MNPTQKQKIVTVISEDCQITHKYVNELGQTCAIGALCLATDLELPEFDDMENSESISCVWFCQDLMMHYGLSEQNLIEIQNLNDTRPTPEERRQAILKYLETIPLAKA